jgi:RNA polymerase sigma-70 factor (ECF subfamily)
VTRPRAVAVTAQAGDAELLARVASGDLAALGEMYDRYARDVWRAVRRSLGDDADVDDVLHTMFLQLPRIAPSYDGRASCRGWLCGIAVRLAMRHRRGLGRFRRMLASFAAAAPPPSSSRDPEREASSDEEMVLLERAMARLSDKKRAVFVLVELEGLSAEEAARALDVPAPTVRTRLFHARQELQAALAAHTGREAERGAEPKAREGGEAS